MSITPLIMHNYSLLFRIIICYNTIEIVIYTEEQ
ncbi:hypothetical protein BCD96_002382 [Clostridium beijerinckii]|jgi:hypothetical protein|uniref:Uncharacterized protein n=1 Tax=Clostridium beijerinckii TaxID=1520 RepID=A0A1S8SA66_CLOBE|nr:hypothetical protein [Clostridium beijerinckii]NOW04115.1 hypothetical protein [Clostridium beijerinckii]NOW91382.1 hypothetical protein [Clostridium beijerinckii]NRT23940.1 hypothetical protein [Clostridium beijerinckii]NRT35057.1 hypothetical protein [Clostridium beijerinckii]